MYIFIYDPVKLDFNPLHRHGRLCHLRQKGSNVYVLACILTCDRESQFPLSSTSGTQMSGNFSIPIQEY